MLFATANSFAQGRGHDKIEKLKFEYITKSLNLSTQQADEFWPVYNEYDNAKQMLFRKYKRDAKDDNLSNQDVEHRMEREKEFLDLRTKYINRFSKILTPVQLTDLKRAEREFKKILLRRSQEQ